MNLLEKEFITLVIEIKDEIVTMDSLQHEMLSFNDTAIKSMGTEDEDEAKEDLAYALEQYHEQKEYLHKVLETWFDHTKRLNMPVDINYYRILRQIRDMIANGH